MAHPNIAALEQAHRAQRRQRGTGEPERPTAATRTLAERCGDHRDCTVITHYVAADSGEPWAAPAWWSHAPSRAHVGCRLGEQTPTCEDHTGAEDGELLDAPPVVEWTPQCVACHLRFGHTPTLHRRHPLLGAGDHRGLALEVGMSAQAWPDDGFVARGHGGDLEFHHGATWQECTTCQPRALACDGCRQELEGGGMIRP